MKIIILDVETTGLPNKQDKNLNNQPHIIQYACIMGEINEDGEFKKELENNLLFKPPVLIPYIVSEIHHIYNIDVKNKQSIGEDLVNIANNINKCDIVIGHNITFDIGMLKIEVERLKRKGILIDLAPKKLFCTMNESINYCKIPKKTGKGYKKPKLQELCKKALGEYFTGSHNALVDIEYTLKAFLALYKLGVFKLKEREQQGLFN